MLKFRKLQPLTQIFIIILIFIVLSHIFRNSLENFSDPRCPPCPSKNTQSLHKPDKRFKSIRIIKGAGGPIKCYCP